MEAIILAGGLGTRLQNAVPNLPKCMAPINGVPFLKYVIDWLQQNGVNSFIFSLGYRHQDVTNYLDAAYPQLCKKYVIEQEPLGTGGAIVLACKAATKPNVIVTNGDTLFKIDIEGLLQTHITSNACCTLALKPMLHFDRYGVVELNPQHQITMFKEKQQYDKGLINGGFYMINTTKFLANTYPEKFSFEQQYLEPQVALHNIYGFVDEGYFIDIGIPDDYKKAANEL
jgi:D-glycero-alpha-D-manno-heptose 1-phosphate guanylyltransferase